MKINHLTITNTLLFLILIMVILVYLKLINTKLFIDNFEDEPVRNLAAQRKLLRTKIDQEQKLN